jgi:hypothetical protein
MFFHNETLKYFEFYVHVKNGFIFKLDFEMITFYIYSTLLAPKGKLLMLENSFPTMYQSIQ